MNHDIRERKPRKKTKANSALRHVGTNFWIMMNQERLNALLLVCIHKDIFLNYETKKSTSVHPSKYPRRMFLINPESSK